MLYNVQDLVYKLKTYKKQEANFIVFLLFSNLISILICFTATYLCCSAFSSTNFLNASATGERNTFLSVII